MAREEIPEEKKLELIFAKEQTAIKANDLQGFIFYFNMYYLSRRVIIKRKVHHQ